MTRCYNTNHDTYHKYGGRGITVCERWHTFVNFLEDMGEKPFPAAQIERKDNNGPYSPDNCIWATRKRQARNRRTTRYLTLGDRSMSMADWADATGLPLQSIARRLQSGWSVERALTTPLDSKKCNRGVKPTTDFKPPATAPG